MVLLGTEHSCVRCLFCAIPVLAFNNIEVSSYSVLTSIFIIKQKMLKPDINNEHVLHTFKIRSRMSLVPDSRSVPRRQPVPVSLRLTLDPTHPVT